MRGLDINEWKAFCKSCEMSGRYDTAEEAEQACFDHYDETGHSDVWYGPSNTASPRRSTNQWDET